MNHNFVYAVDSLQLLSFTLLQGICGLEIAYDLDDLELDLTYEDDLKDLPVSSDTERESLKYL